MPMDGLGNAPQVPSRPLPLPPAALELPPLKLDLPLPSLPAFDLSSLPQVGNLGYDVGPLDFGQLAEVDFPSAADFALEQASFEMTKGLEGDCAVQAYFELASADAANLKAQVKQGLQAGTEPFEVTVVSANDGTGTKAEKVMVDPKVYQGLIAPAPEGPGLSPSEAYTMVCRLAVAQAIDPGASIGWEARGEGGVLVLNKSEGASGGAGLPAYAVRDFFANLKIPSLLDLAQEGGLKRPPTPAEATGGNVSFLAFLTDPATGTAHPAMVTRSVELNAQGQAEFAYHVGDRGISGAEIGAQVANFFMGTVAPNGGLTTSGGKTPKKWPG